MSAKDTLARKYRPKILTDLVGQDSVVRTLTNAVIQGKLHQCYLFVGQFGSGKTSCARILAAMENCEISPGVAPCGTCDICSKIYAGTHTDIEELDAAGKFGKVDETRKLKASALYRSVDGAKKKYYIIDECLGKNSRVETEKGLIHIDKIVNRKMPLRVRSYNEQTGEIEWKKITNWFKNSGKVVYAIGFETSGRLYACDNHTVYTPHGECLVADLAVGDIVLRRVERMSSIQEQLVLREQKVMLKSVSGHEDTTYDIEVEDNHNYFVSGTLVHNCHRMSLESGDSLLKLLEEPPNHVRFVLCSTDVQKIRPAIQSRCQRHDFKKIYWRQIQERLEYVAKQEKIAVEKAALTLCARLSKGSMRNALMSLEKLMSFAGTESATLDHAQSMFGTPADLLYYDLFDEVIGLEDGKVDGTKGYRIINDMLSGGAEFSIIYDGLAEHLRSVMIGMSSSAAGEFLFLSDAGKERLKKQLKKVQETGKLNAVLYSFNKLHDAAKAVNMNISPEAALQQWFLECVCAFRHK